MSLNPSQLLDFNDLFSKEVDSFKSKVIDGSIDKSLEKVVTILKSDLKEIFVETQKTTIKPADERLKEIQAKTTDLDIIKKLTNLKDLTPKKSFSELEDGIIFGSKNQNNIRDSRMSLEISHSLIDDLEVQYMKAREFFANAVFALPNKLGGYDYYKNNGFVPSEDLKIKCSKYTGTDNEAPFGGFSPQERFNKDASVSGTSTWTLKQRFLDQIPNNSSFTHLNAIVEDVKNADIAAAKRRTAAVAKESARLGFDTSLDSFPTDESGELYKTYRVFDLIRNIKVQKDIRNKSTIYKIITSDFSSGLKEDKDFITEATRQISFLKITETQNIIRAIEKKIAEFIKRIEK